MYKFFYTQCFTLIFTLILQRCRQHQNCCYNSKFCNLEFPENNIVFTDFHIDDRLFRNNGNFFILS